MSIISPAERALLNVHPQQTKMYLSVYRPSLALIGEIAGSYDASNQSIEYTAVSGSYTGIQDYLYQVALIGTSAGADDVGRTWVRSATSDTLRFVESDHINWSIATHITVLSYTEIIPVFPRIIQNPSNEEDVIFYKVWDIPYTNQNSILGTFICMGSHYAGFLDDGSCEVYWSASGTSNLLGESITHSWIFEGATITGSNAHTPGMVSYNAPGHYRTIYTATSESGRVDKSVRYVSIYDRPGIGSNTPILNFELMELGGSRDSVGYTSRVRIRDNFTSPDFIDGALVVIFKEDWYGSTKQSISKNAMGREGIFFVGYINGGTIQYNYRDGYVEFDVLSPTNLMEITECFSVSVESKPVPTVWYELNDMNVSRAMYHYLAWHSSVLLCCDFETRNLDDRYIQYFDADRTSLYDAVNSVLQGALRGRLISDSLGKLWAERDVSVIDNASVVLPTTLRINKYDWLDSPTISERQLENVSFIELGGIAYNPVSGESTPLLASAPGTAPSYHGKVERSQGFALSDQTELNTLVGNLYASMNARYPSVDLKLRGNFANVDIAPQEIIKLTIAQEDTPRGISFASKPFAIRGVSQSWDANNEVLLTQLQLSEVTQGFVGASIIIPVEPPDTDSGGGTVSQPPVTVPPIPVPTTPFPTGTAVNVYENGAFKMTTNNLNFVGSIVRVHANTDAGRADIYFDACGCSGSFIPSGGVLCTYVSETATFPNGTQLEDEVTLFAFNDPSYTGSSSDPCALIAFNGTNTFRAPWTAYYSLGIGGIRIQPFMEIDEAADVDISYELYFGGELKRSGSGNVSKAAGAASPSFIDYFEASDDIYLQVGEFLDVRLYYDLFINEGTFTNTVSIGTAAPGITPSIVFSVNND